MLFSPTYEEAAGTSGVIRHNVLLGAAELWLFSRDEREVPIE